jgi:hypothetical protein
MTQQAATIRDARFDIDFIVLADWSEVINGKLYLQGGGWDTIHAPSFPTSRNVAVAVSLSVPWAETNRTHKMEFKILNEDTGQVLAHMDGEMVLGRPPDLPPGSDQVALVSLNSPLTFEGAAQCVFIVTLNGEERKRKAFRVRQAGLQFSLRRV